MTVPVPVAGDEGVYTWGSAVATQLNRMIPLDTTADQSSDSTSLADVTGLTFAVTSGRRYNGTLRLWYSASSTAQGCQVGVSCPAGDVLATITTYGQSSPSGTTGSVLASSGSATGVTTTDDNGAARRHIIVHLDYDCTADGTFAIQFRRGGTSGSTGVTIRKGSGGIVLVSA